MCFDNNRIMLNVKFLREKNDDAFFFFSIKR
jgi:hypothetical protein